jgi:PucR family transcriptional regulator, purine catabolism regulatory protein
MVNDFLSNPLLKNSTLLSADQVVSTKTIESVSVIEIPVEDFVRENDLVLTTAIGCGTNSALFLSFVNDIYTSGASALAIATGRHVDCIPEEIIQFANEHHFPLIELPWEIRFSDIIKTVLEQTHQLQQDSLVKTELLQKKLLQLFIDNRTLQEALDYLSNQFNRHICFLQQGNNPLISPDWTHNIDSIGLVDHKNMEQMMIPTEKGTLVQILPIPMLNHEIGLLLLESDSAVSPPIPWSILDQIATTLTLWLQKEQTMLTNKIKKMEDFIQLLIKKEWLSKETVIEQGRILGIHIETSYVCILGYPENLREFQLKKGKGLTNHSWNMHLPKILKEAAEAAAGTLKRQLFCHYHRDRFIIFLESHIDDASQNANAFLDLLDHYIKKGEIPLFSWGIGEHHAGILTFHKSFKNARTALEIGRSHKGPGQRSTYANTGTYRLLTLISSESSAVELMHSTIGAVASYNKEKGLDLLHTLGTYIYLQGNASQTSRALSLHRQSLLYRLRKIESLTKRSLSDPDDLFLLELCLKLWTLRFESNSLEN